jgi:hypothetical protein
VESDYFDPQIRAVGWSRDGKRVFVVSAFGMESSVLLSFSVEGNDDYWEGLVDPEAGWTDGFIMDPVATRERPS